MKKPEKKKSQDRGFSPFDGGSEVRRIKAVKVQKPQKRIRPQDIDFEEE